MLEHQQVGAIKPSRVVILGGTGFIGKKLNLRLSENKINVLSIGSQQIDLCEKGASKKLVKILRADDSLVILSALTPEYGRDTKILNYNLKMLETICDALRVVKIKHVVYMSSDAVYPLDITPINEQSFAAPTELYGVMHLAREIMLKERGLNCLCIFRLTLTYGVEDTHKSYGPNRFYQEAVNNGVINLGGNGEEMRDHIYIDDVTKLIELALLHISRGLLNLASGKSVDFASVANQLANLLHNDITVKTSKRRIEVTHRAFDVSAIYNAFPDFSFTPLNEGLKDLVKSTHEK